MLHETVILIDGGGVIVCDGDGDTVTVGVVHDEIIDEIVATTDGDAVVVCDGDGDTVTVGVADDEKRDEIVVFMGGDTVIVRDVDGLDEMVELMDEDGVIVCDGDDETVAVVVADPVMLDVTVVDIEYVQDGEGVVICPHT